jgi:hypothetical protein
VEGAYEYLNAEVPKIIAIPDDEPWADIKNIKDLTGAIGKRSFGGSLHSTTMQVAETRAAKNCHCGAFRLRPSRGSPILLPTPHHAQRQILQATIQKWRRSIFAGLAAS